MTMTKEKALDRAKIGLLQIKNSTFISTVLFNLKVEWDESVPTACTDGLRRIIGPDFFMKLDKEERVFLLAHEAWHVAFQHMSRLNQEERQLQCMESGNCHYIVYLIVQDIR